MERSVCVRGDKRVKRVVGALVVMIALSAALQIAVAGVLLSAAVGKLLAPHEFFEALRLTNVSQLFARGASWLLPAAEVLLALAVVASPRRVVVAALAISALLFAVFASWSLYVVSRRLTIACGCFGEASRPVNNLTIIRNVGLVLVAASGAVAVSRTGTAFGDTSADLVMATLTGALLVALIMALRHVGARLVLTDEALERIRELHRAGD